MQGDLSEEQKRLRDEVISFAQRELNDDLIRRDCDGDFSHEAWKNPRGLAQDVQQEWWTAQALSKLEQSGSAGRLT